MIKANESVASVAVGVLLTVAAVALRVVTVQFVFQYGLPHFGLAGVRLDMWQAWAALVVLAALFGSVGKDKDEATILSNGVSAFASAAVGLLLVWAIL